MERKREQRYCFMKGENRKRRNRENRERKRQIQREGGQINKNRQIQKERSETVKERG